MNLIRYLGRAGCGAQVWEPTRQSWRCVPVPGSSDNANVCVVLQSVCAPQLTPAVRIAAGTVEDFKKGSLTGLRPWARREARGPQQPPSCQIKTFHCKDSEGLLWHGSDLRHAGALHPFNACIRASEQDTCSKVADSSALWQRKYSHPETNVV